MPLNQRKIIRIILDECESIEEWCDGYNEKLIGVITEILKYESAHRVARTNIQKKINDEFRTAAVSLAKQCDHNMNTED